MLALLTVGLATSARGYDYFRHLRTGSEEIKAIYPDASGRVWIGTIHGLQRYGDFPHDGNNRYDYYPEKFKAGIQSIQNYDGNRLLIRTLDDGRFVIYNPGTNVIEDNFDDILLQWGIDYGNRWSMSIKSDAHNNLWIYWDGNLYVHREGDSGPAAKVSGIEGRIKDIGINTERFCILTDSKIYICSIADLTPITAIDIVDGDNTRDRFVAIDSNGNVWISGDNLSRYDTALSRWTTIKRNIFITDMVASKTGDILVATNTSGILRFDPDGNEVQTMRHVPYDASTLASDNIRWIIEDADTTLWVCYDKRMISACNPLSNYPVYHHIPLLKRLGLDDDIISATQEASGDIWLGSNGHGVYRMNSTGTAIDIPSQLENLGNTAISSLFTDSRGRVWIGTFRNGLFRYDNGRVTAWLPQMSVYGIAEDDRGGIWLGLLGGGIRYIDPDDAAAGPVTVAGLDREWVSDLAYNGRNTLYATSSNGLISIDTNTRKSDVLKTNRRGTQTIRNHNFQSVFNDSRGLVWLVGLDFDTPVEIYDPACDSLLYIPRLKDNVIKSVVEDDSKNIWLTSEQSVIHIIVNYDVRNRCYSFVPAIYRFQDPSGHNETYHNYRAATKLNNGKILIGSSDGFQIINPADYPPFTTGLFSPRLYISSIKVNNSYLKSGNTLNGRHIIDRDIADISSIDLNHDENNLILTIGSKDLTTGYNTDLYYRLDGRDDEWRPIRGNIIELPNLRPGNYSLVIGSERADGTMSDNILTLKIKIKFPWYATWVAQVLYILLTLAIVALAIYYYLDRQKQKLYVTQIRREAERQYHLNEMKLRFFTNISHDFRTPLSLIITPLETFMSDPANKTAARHLQPVYKNALRLLNLINQILDFRKIDINGTALNPSYGDLVSFIRDICSSFTLFAEDTDKHITFTSSSPSVNMYFDKDKMTKIMMNLLSNSFKFTGQGSEIQVGVNVRGENVEITVADDGCGIPDDKKPHIFERFYQTDTQRSEYIGSGIGLHIVKEFVAIHNGTVSVADNRPAGTVFTITIPIVKNNPAGGDDVPAAVDAEADAVEAAQLPAGHKNLLVVEDNPDFIEYLREQLSADYNVYTASNGIEALKVLDNHEINIIISDIMMDGMDGLELCRKVKTNLTTSHIPVILLTAKALPEDEVRGIECGADAYITKPFNMQLLRRRVGKLLDDSMKYQLKFKEKLDVNPSEITITSLDERFLSAAIKCVEDNMASPDFSVETMSGMLGVHRTQLYKKLMNLTGKSPADFIRIIRLKRAAQYLAKSQMFVSEIAYTVGFNSPKLFAKHFKEEFGVSPRDYQNKSSDPGPGPDD